MKLAEALITRKELTNELNSIYNRIHDNLIGQEGELPSEEPNELIRIMEDKSKELGLLIARINKTNTVTMFDDNMTITDAIAKKDYLNELHRKFSNISRQASIRPDRYSKTEIKAIKYVDVAKLQKRIDDIAKEYRELDIKLQEKNWNVELI